MVYVYDYEGTDEEIGIEVLVNLTVQKDICMTLKQTKGNDIYYSYIAAKIKEEFLYCQVQYD